MKYGQILAKYLQYLTKETYCSSEVIDKYKTVNSRKLLATKEIYSVINQLKSFSADLMNLSEDEIKNKYHLDEFHRL